MPNSHPAPNGLVKFGVFELDTRSGELRRFGFRIRLQEQPLRVLQVLLENPGRVVTRDELQRRLWPSNTFVEFDKGIYNAIKRLRETLNDTAETPTYIETLPRRGYRFIGPVSNGDGRSAANLAKGKSPSASPKIAKPLMFAGIAAALTLAFTVAVIRWRAANVAHSSAPDLKLVKVTDNSLGNPIRYAAISPDGKFIAYTDADGIHVKNIETDDAKRIAPPVDSQVQRTLSADVRFPISWFPDGTRLLVSTKPHLTMWSVSLLTGNAQKLGEDGWASSVSPDGSLIAFVRNDSEIWIMGSRGEQPRLFVRAEPNVGLERVLWSPDSKRIAYLKISERPEVLECSIETRRLDTALSTSIVSDTQLCQEQPVGFWTPDDRIVFSRREAVGEGSNLWSVRVNSRTAHAEGPPVRITNWPQSFVTGISGSADGKRLILRRTVFNNLTYLMEMGRTGRAESHSLRLLLSQKDAAWPTAWTADSRDVVFYRMNGENSDIFRQDISKDSPEPLVKAPGEQLTPRLSPDGSFFIYMDVATFQHFGSRSPVRLMRIPKGGGPSELVLVSEGYVGHRCPRLPAKFCVLAETSADQRHLVFYTFDPVLGSALNAANANKHEIFSIDVEAGHEPDWDVSPDGSLIAIAAQDEKNIPLSFVALNSRPSFKMTVKGWGNRHSLFWSPDGHSVYVSSRSFNDETLLQVDLRGRVRPLFKQKGAYAVWGVPSPDGHYLAILSIVKDSDLWMAENF